MYNLKMILAEQQGLVTMGVPIRHVKVEPNLTAIVGPK
jgi:hypothetical protein